MKVEMLCARMYREEHLDAGRITDMDEATARCFIARGWAKESLAPPVLTTAQADALIPPKGKTRRALR